MKFSQMKFRIIFFALFLYSFSVFAQKKFVVDAKKIGPEIQPEMFGVFFEDINFGADGGLYAELIKNRSFEFNNNLVGWTPFGDVQVLKENPCFDKNPYYVRITENGNPSRAGLENNGFRGIGLKMNESYRFSFYARVLDGLSKNCRIELVNDDDVIIGEGLIVVEGKEWQKYTSFIESSQSDAYSKVRLILEDQGVVDFDHISMFPVETWKNRENGLRKDLVQSLYELHPGVFRFPGGCIVEGNTLATRYQWKNTVGPVGNRPVNINRWNYTFKHRKFPDYYQSYGLGFYEYFLLCEDLGAEPLPVLNVGLACQYVSTECVPVGELGPYIQDAIDLIEFANGSKDSQWGKVRADMGHPEPFNLKMIAIGNEQWDKVYVERLTLFVEAIRKAYPEIKIVGGSGPTSSGDKFSYLWPEMKKLKVDLVDEHYYKSPEWFLENADRYDDYDRKGPKVFAGEYAAHPKSRNNSMRGAISEAAFMTGLERNADVVTLATYAPLFAHVNAWQWKPDMIWFNNLSFVRTPNYYVQQMYATNQGTNVLNITYDNEHVVGQDSLYASAEFDENTSEIIVKIVNAGDTINDITIDLKGLKTLVLNREVKITELRSNDPQIINTLESPLNVFPKQSSVWAEDNKFTIKIFGNSFYVCRIKTE